MWGLVPPAARRPPEDDDVTRHTTEQKGAVGAYRGTALPQAGQDDVSCDCDAIWKHSSLQYSARLEASFARFSSCRKSLPQ